MNCGFCKVGNVVIDSKCIPLFLCSCVVYIGEFAAISERRITNCGNTVRNCYVYEVVTARECRLANRGNAVGDCYTCEAGATVEGMITDHSNTVRECYANSKKEWCLC